MDRKSQENLDSADLLIKNGKYNSSIHCSYYAVFQYIKYALCNSPRNPMSYSNQNLMSLSGSSHVRILRELKNRMNIIDGNMQDASLIGNRIELLKDNRVNADYNENFVFDYNGSNDCLNEAKSIIELIKNKFGL